MTSPSETAKRGNREQRDVVRRLNDSKDKTAEDWRRIICRNKPLKAKLGEGRSKNDVIVEFDPLHPTTAAIQVKFYAALPGFNSVGRQTLGDCRARFGGDDTTGVFPLLTYFCGEKRPQDYDPDGGRARRSKDRLYLDEFSQNDRNKILEYFRKKRPEIVRAIFEGDTQLKPTFLLVIRAVGGVQGHLLVPMKFAIDFFANGIVGVSIGTRDADLDDVEFTSRGNLRLGQMTMQRKGSKRDPRPNDLQFKVRLEDLWTECIRLSCGNRYPFPRQASLAR